MLSNFEKLRLIEASSKWTADEYALRRAEVAKRIWSKNQVPSRAPMSPSELLKTRKTKYDVNPILDEGCPDARSFIVKVGVGLKPASDGSWLTLTVVGHTKTNSKDLAAWLREVLVAHGGRSNKITSSSMAVPYKEFTSKGSFGPSLKAADCEDIVEIFDEAAAFLKMLDTMLTKIHHEREKVPEKDWKAQLGHIMNVNLAKQIHDEMNNETLTSGELRWTIMGYLK